MPYLFTSESVSEGHPDKIADQISDAMLDQFLAQDNQSKVACETLVTTGLVVLSGETKSAAQFDYHEVVRNVIRRIGYTKSEYRFDADSCAIISALHEQSADIRQGVDRANPEDQGAGDQGMMFGYASNETENYMPAALYLSHLILEELAAMRRENTDIKYLRPDAKAQVTIQYSDDNKPIQIDTIVVSTQHDDFIQPESDTDQARLAADNAMLNTIRTDIINKVIPRVLGKIKDNLRNLFHDKIKYHINPTGKFVIGGPHGDTGLTGRKIIVDTYGGKGAHGGGAFSGKDPSKVDRSAAYATRYIAKNMVAAGVADEMLVQVSYAIGVADPMGIYVNTNGTARVNMTDGEIANKIGEIFNLRPYNIERMLKLRQPMYEETAAYGHMGRHSHTVTKTFTIQGQPVQKEVELFTWEKLDQVEAIRKAFGL